jgi:hypothetical protein
MECNEQLHTCVNNALYEDISKLDACFTAFTDCLPPVSGRENGGIPPPPPMTSTIEEPTATTDPEDCFNDYRSCLQNASTFEGRNGCRSRFRSCLGPPGAEVELNEEEIDNSDEAHVDTTSDLNNEGADVMVDVTQEVHKFHKYSCIEILKRCLAAAIDVDAQSACYDAYSKCSGPKAAVTFIEEIHGSNEAQYDTTTSDLNTEGYGLRGNFLKND